MSVSNPPQPDITRTIKKILFKDGIWPLYPESSDEAVHKLVTLVQDAREEQRNLFVMEVDNLIYAQPVGFMESYNDALKDVKTIMVKGVKI